MWTRLKDWIDGHQTTSFAYVFLGGLVVAGCCCGGCATYLFTWLWS